MAESGTSFLIDIPAKADQVIAAAAALDQLAQRHAAAKSVADAAAEAVKAGEGSYRQAEAAYDRAAKSLERVTVAMSTASGEGLERLQAKQSDAAVAANAAREEMERQAIALDTLKVSSIAANQAVEELSNAQRAAKDSAADQKKAAAESAEFAEKAGSAFGAIGGPLGAAGSKVFQLQGAWGKLSKVMGAGGPYVAAALGVALVAGAFIALTAKVVEGAIALGRWAVSLANANRSNQLLAAGMVQSQAGGEALSKAIDDAAKRFPRTREEIASTAAELAKTGLRGEALNAALEDANVTAAEAKYGPEWQREMNSLEQSQKRLKLNNESLFRGLKIEKLLAGLATLVDTFDEGTASGKAIKVVFESIFQPMVDGATNMIPKVRHAFLQFQILALKALIAIAPFSSTLLTIGKVIAVVAALTVGLLAAAIGVVIGLIAAMGAALVLPIALFAALAAGIAWVGVKLFELGATIVRAIKGFSLEATGQALIEGLAKGITAGAAVVVNAVKGAANGAIDAAKKALGIASPSKVFAEIGMNTAAGMETGVDQGAAGVQGALTDLAAPPAVAGAPKGAGPAAQPSGGTYTIEINVTGGGGAQATADAVRDALANLLESMAIQSGTSVPT